MGCGKCDLRKVDLGRSPPLYAARNKTPGPQFLQTVGTFTDRTIRGWLKFGCDMERTETPIKKPSDRHFLKTGICAPGLAAMGTTLLLKLASRCAHSATAKGPW
jgi:hypothetical protein